MTAPVKRTRINPLSVARTHPKKTAAGVMATVLGFVVLAAPLCPLLPPPYGAICSAVTMGAKQGAPLLEKLDKSALDEGRANDSIPYDAENCTDGDGLLDLAMHPLGVVCDHECPAPFWRDIADGGCLTEANGHGL